MIEQLEQLLGVGLFGVVVVSIFVVLVGLLIDFLPTLVSLKRDTNSTLPIFALNLLFGWTVIGWIGLLYWALTAPTKDRYKRHVTAVRSSEAQPQINEPLKSHSTPTHILFSDKVLLIPQLPVLLDRPLWCVDSGQYTTINEGDWINPGDVILRYTVKHPTDLSLIIGRDTRKVAEVRSPISGRLLIRRSWPFGSHGDQPEAISSLCAIEIPVGQHIPATLSDAFDQFCDILWNYRDLVFQKPTDGSFPPYSDEDINQALNEIRALRPQIRSKSDEVFRTLVDKYNLQRPDTVGSPENLKRN